MIGIAKIFTSIFSSLRTAKHQSIHHGDRQTVQNSLQLSTGRVKFHRRRNGKHGIQHRNKMNNNSADHHGQRSIFSPFINTLMEEKTDFHRHYKGSKTHNKRCHRANRVFVGSRMCTRIYVNDDVSSASFIFWIDAKDVFCAIFRVMCVYALTSL